jgi:hypothetical protein
VDNAMLEERIRQNLEIRKDLIKKRMDILVRHRQELEEVNLKIKAINDARQRIVYRAREEKRKVKVLPIPLGPSGRIIIDPKSGNEILVVDPK